MGVIYHGNLQKAFRRLSSALLTDCLLRVVVVVERKNLSQVTERSTTFGDARHVVVLQELPRSVQQSRVVFSGLPHLVYGLLVGVRQKD